MPDFYRYPFPIFLPRKRMFWKLFLNVRGRIINPLRKTKPLLTTIHGKRACCSRARKMPIQSYKNWASHTVKFNYISSSLVQVINIQLFCLMDADGEGVISPWAGPSIMSSFWSAVQGTKECTGHAQQVIFPQLKLPEGMETGSLREFRAETAAPHHHPLNPSTVSLLAWGCLPQVSLCELVKLSALDTEPAEKTFCLWNWWVLFGGSKELWYQSSLCFSTEKNSVRAKW